MLRFWLAVTGMAVSVSAWGTACGPVKEYSQYKDRARTGEGRLAIAREYCLYAAMIRVGLPTREFDECQAAQSKIVDAIRSDKKAVDVALSGCPDIFGKPPPRSPICKYRDAEGRVHYSASPPENGWALISCTDPVQP